MTCREIIQGKRLPHKPTKESDGLAAFMRGQIQEGISFDWIMSMINTSLERYANPGLPYNASVAAVRRLETAAKEFADALEAAASQTSEAWFHIRINNVPPGQDIQPELDYPRALIGEVRRIENSARATLPLVAKRGRPIDIPKAMVGVELVCIWEMATGKKATYWKEGSTPFMRFARLAIALSTKKDALEKNFDDWAENSVNKLGPPFKPKPRKAPATRPATKRLDRGLIPRE